MRRVSFFILVVSLNFFLFVGIVPTNKSLAEPLLRDSPQYAEVLVEEVLSADTFVLEGGEKIRLIGLKAPKTPKKKIRKNEHNIIIREVNPIIPISERAFYFAKELLENKYVRLEFDVQKKDDDFYTVAYAFLPDETFVNAEILRQGFANLKIVQPNIKYADELRKAYREARGEKRGLQGE